VKPVRADFDKWYGALPPGQAKRLDDLRAGIEARPDIGGANGDYAVRTALLGAAAALGFVRQDETPQARARPRGKG
jgi:hypothetical protein